MTKLHELRQQQAAHYAAVEDLLAKMSADEIDDESFEALNAEKDSVQAKIDRNAGLIDEAIKLDEKKRALIAAAPAPKVSPEPKATPEKFKSLGEQLAAVAHAAQDGNFRHGTADNRLTHLWNPSAAATGHNEATPSDGGFLVQEDFSTSLLEVMQKSGQVIGRARNIPISNAANKVKLPAVDETSRANGSRSGGVRAYWMDEAGAHTASEMKFRTVELGLNKVGALTYVTDELLRDAAALGSYINTAYAEEMTFVVEDAMINGDGAGKPLGILNSGALISVAKESGQAAATVVTANILKMWSRMPFANRARAVWFVNQDVETQLYQLTLAGGGDANLLMFRPAGTPGADGAFGMLLGRPVVPVEYCATLGTVGDIVLADMGSYTLGTKDQVQRAESMHVRFLYEEMAFRWTYRIDGQPIWRTALTPFKGSNTLSPFVALATRA